MSNPDVVPKHPIQPQVVVSGLVRFKPNAIIDHMWKEGIIDLNALARIPFPAEDRQQLAQLLGYSLAGYSTLSYVDNLAFELAQQQGVGPDDKDKRIAYLEAKLEKLREALRDPIAELYDIHPNNLDR